MQEGETSRTGSGPVEQKPSISAPGFRAVIRDVAILWGITFIGGFVIGFMGEIPHSDPAQRMFALGLTNMALMIICFVVIGCLVGGRRWKHLFIVTTIVWITSFLNLFFGMSFEHCLLNFPLSLILMTIGGGISCLIRETRRCVDDP